MVQLLPCSKYPCFLFFFPPSFSPFEKASSAPITFFFVCCVCYYCKTESSSSKIKDTYVSLAINEKSKLTDGSAHTHWCAVRRWIEARESSDKRFSFLLLLERPDWARSTKRRRKKKKKRAAAPVVVVGFLSLFSFEKKAVWRAQSWEMGGGVEVQKYKMSTRSERRETKTSASSLKKKKRKRE